MVSKIVSGIMLILLVLSMLSLALKIQVVKADGGTIYINADGSISPSTAPISTVDNVTYTFTGNITDSILIERNNIVVDGAGYTMQGPGGAEDGIFSTSSNITIKSTNIKNYGFGITLESSNYNSISGNNITANTYDGIWLGYSSCYNSVIGNNITDDRTGITINHSSNYNNISGNYMTANNGDGIADWACSNNIISGNNITANIYDGIMLYVLDGPSNYNGIYGNSITANNEYGIYLYGSLSNIISGNNITANLYDGIWLDHSSNYNSISGNNITNNRYGINLGYSCSDNSISGNNITANNVEGIGLWYSSNYNSISGNNITADTGDGILHVSCSGNTISGNTIADNQQGIGLASSSGNGIFHNNFINNTHQISSDGTSTNIWDDGYPSGGNCWSDYNGSDVCGGPYQNETGSDGIGDTPYTIDANNLDNYPLMNPYSMNPLSLTISPASSTLNVGQPQTFNSTVSGGTLPYTYQWCLNGTAIQDANFSSWTFTPTSAGLYTIYANVTDSVGVQATSNTANVTVNPGTHDVAVTNVTSYQTITGQGLCNNVTVTIANLGGYSETFNVTAYANATVIAAIANINLVSGNSVNQTILWNTTGFAYGNYTISAYASPVPGETDTANNNFTGGWIIVSLVGDLTGPNGWPDGKVDIRDVHDVAKLYGTTSSSPNWDPNCDVTGPAGGGVPDGIIDIRDVHLAAVNYGQHFP